MDGRITKINTNDYITYTIMALTEQEKNDIKKEILNDIKAESTDIKELGVVTSLNGLTGLPAMQGDSLVLAPLSLLSKPATDAAGVANAAAKNANTSSEMAIQASGVAESAADTASRAAQTALEATEAANEAASNIGRYDSRISMAEGGTTARFDEIVPDAQLAMTAAPDGGSIVYVQAKKLFACRTDGATGAEYHLDWPTVALYLNESKDSIQKDKVYLLGGTGYVWDDDEGTLVEFDGSGSGSGFYNVTSEQPLVEGYYTKDSAIAALAEADIDDEVKSGMIITFEESAGKWKDYRFVGSGISSFLIPASWEEYGGGKIKSISLNGEEVSPDADGNVALRIDQVQVDESLDEDSTNPVQNAVVTRKIKEIGDAAVGGVEVIPDGDKNTLNILNKQGGIIASAEFTGGGGSGGTTASRIILTATLDKVQLKEGGHAELTYTYNHVNSEGDATGIKADLTIIVSRGTTTTYEKTIKGVSAGTYHLDVSDYLLVGTTDIYVKANVTTEDGTRQTKQAYTSINVITLTLTSSYNLAATIAGGGYKSSDTIEIPFTITGSGTKDVSMYVDGATTPVSQTINKSGTVNGSFSIAGSSLTPGWHSVQLVAERNGLKSDSIYIDILKAGQNAPFIGIKYTDTLSRILESAHIPPVLTAAQYEQMSFDYIAYDPAATPAKVDVYLNGKHTSTINAPRQMQKYINRFTSKGTNTLMMKVGSKSYTLNIDVKDSSIDLSEALYGIMAKFDAAGRSNSESDPAQWESNGIKTIFEGFDWNSNGWTGDSLRLTNGAKATIDYKPFASDIKSTGITIEMTMKVSNVMKRSANVVSCIHDGKGLLFTAENASFKTGQTVDYTNEDDELVTREIKLGTNYVADRWMKVAFTVCTRDDNRLMHIYVDGNRTGADVYDTSFNFAQDVPQNIVIDSSEADVEIRSIRIYNRAISDDEELDNRIVDAETSDEMMALFDDNNILGDKGDVDIDKLRAKGKGVLRIVRKNKLDDVYAENNKKTDFKADVYFYSPFGKEYDFVLLDCYIRIQGTSSTKYPSKNIRIYYAKGGELLSFTVNGVKDPYGKNRYAMRPGAIPMNLYTLKSDYSDSSMSMNTGGAKLFNDSMKELGLLTPPQRHQYENGGNQLSAINVRTAIDGFPIDVFCAETVDGESEYYGQYNFNNEKSKSEDLFGMTNVNGFNPSMPMTFETLNNGEKLCLFKSDSDDDVAANFDAGLETNYPDDVKWAGLTEAQRNAVKRLFGWIRDCVPAGANSNDLSTFVSKKFKDEIDQYFDKDFILTYYLWTDYYLSVDQRAKNMMLRTWDGLKWYITYYDGDTQLGKRNDCFLVYQYTTDRDTYDAEAAKYAFEGRDSWLWNLVLANLQEDLRRLANNLRGVMTDERVLDMFNNEQAGNWSDRAFNKSGEIKYIRPAIQEMYGKVWPFIYALQGSNRAHREFFIRNRFALLDAKYGTSNFTSDNVDMYLSRSASDDADVIRITANEVYAFGYGTNNSPNIANTGIVQEGETADLSITRNLTVNDPVRLYGASRMEVLDMTDAAEHLKNGLDLGKCKVLRELNLEAKNGGSTGWWLVIDACRSLRRLNVRNQKHAKTGSSTSKELDLSKQNKLEFLDAGGTEVESVNFAQGAPLTTAYLPRTLTVLRLEYLAQLKPDGLSIESYANIGTFIFAGCPNLDWQTLLGRCTNITYMRITGVDMEGDGTLLNRYMTAGGVDAKGNFTPECKLIGTYKLNRYPSDEDLAKWTVHYDELNIVLPEYTMIEFDDSITDDANVTNLDNGTGSNSGTEYVPSGHISAILKKRHRVLAKVTRKASTRNVKMAGVDTIMNNLDGEMTYSLLDDTNSNYYADGTPARLDGSEGDLMMYEPFYWGKGINDYLRNKHYSCFSANSKDKMPAVPEVTVLTLDDIKGLSGGYTPGKKVMTGKATIIDSISTDSSYSVCRVDVSAHKRVRFPTVPGTTLVGSVFTDADGRVVETVIVPTLGCKFEPGMYIISDVPEEAVQLHFSILNTAEFDKVVLSNSDRIEDMEPDWVAFDEHLCAVVGSSVVGTTLRAVISGGSTAASMTWTDFHYYSVSRGMQQIDAMMHSRIANLFYAKYGRRNSQEQCGAGSHTNNRTTGGTAKYGMQDTIGFDEAYAIDHSITNSMIDGAVHQYAWYKTKDDYGQTTVTQVNNICCLGYEDIYGHKYDMMDNVDLPNDSGNVGKWRIWMPDGTTRMVKGKTASDQWITAVCHGKHMDIVPVGTVNGSSSSDYGDKYYISTYSARVVYRGNNFANPSGGVSCAYAVIDASNAYTIVGSRLAFCGIIVEAESVVAYKAIAEVA